MTDRYLLLEDHPIVQLGLQQLILSKWPDAVIDTTSTLADACRKAAEQPYTLAVVDVNLADATGLDTVTRLGKVAPGLPILVLSLNDEAAYAQRALQLGARGYLSKGRAHVELIQAMETIAQRGRYITASQAERIADMAFGEGRLAPHELLSQQEYRVLIFLAEGKRLIEIGELMHLSAKTVTTYRARVLEKLRLKTNRELIQYCLDHRIT